MQPLSDDAENVCGLILVRSAAEVPIAVRAVNELLARWRARAAAIPQVLGVLAGAGIDVWNSKPSHGGEGEITLRESTGLSGIWTLCWFELWPLEGSARASARRRRLLDQVRSDLQGTLFPVFTRDEARKGIEPLVEELEDRYPALQVGEDRFVHEPLRGGLSRLPVLRTFPQLH